MDPITQGALGAVCAQLVTGERVPRPRMWLYGALGGMAADLDVLIRSSTDPLVAIDYHRHFTHSLAFVPIGGLLVALPFCLTRREGKFALKASARLIVLASVIGYATHGLLDAFTAYGTMLAWPFSNARIAWDSISIVDPVFTLPLLLGAFLTRRRSVRSVSRPMRPVRVAAAFCAMYMALGVWQHHRAMQAQHVQMVERGHRALVEEDAPKRRCMPTLMSLRRWRGIYMAEHNGQIRVFADAIHVPFFGAAQLEEGASLPRYTHDGANASAFARWSRFADGYVAAHTDAAGKPFIGDERYALSPAALEPMWGLRIAADGSTERVNIRPSLSDAWARFRGEAAEPGLPSTAAHE